MQRYEPAEVRERLIALMFSDPTRAMGIAKALGLWGWLRTEMLDDVLVRLARIDPNFFLEYTLLDPDTLEPVIQQDFQRDWQKMMTDHDWSLIAAPRGHGKTVQVAGRQVWNLGTNPNVRIKIIGSSDDKAKEILGLIRDLIAKNQSVHKVFPELQIDTALGDTKEKFFVKRSVQQRDPSVEASGWSSTGAGGRADFLICDDVVDPKNAIINPGMREQVKKVMSETWFSLVSNRGKVVWICTPYHQQDASHAYRDNGVPYEEVRKGRVRPGGERPWVVWWIPALRNVDCYDDFGEPIMVPRQNEDGSDMVDPETGEVVYTQLQEEVVLWPTYWTKDKLLARKVAIGARTFARQYLLNSMSDEERTFSEDDIKGSFDYELRDIGDGIDPSWPTFGGIDLAATLSDRGAWTVIWTVARHPETGELYLKEMIRKKIRFTQVMLEIEKAFDRHKWRFAYVENNAFQKAVEDSVNENLKHIPLEGFTTGAWNKHNQQAGLPGLATAFAKGLFHLPAARLNRDGFLSDTDGSDYAVFLNELRTHPGGENSDTVMGLWFAYRAALEGNGDFAENYLAAMGA